MNDLLSRKKILEMLDSIYDCNDMVFEHDECERDADCRSCRWRDTKKYIRDKIARMPSEQRGKRHA